MSCEWLLYAIHRGGSGTGYQITLYITGPVTDGAAATVGREYLKGYVTVIRTTTYHNIVDMSYKKIC
jgi:hypothetical protein